MKGQFYNVPHDYREDIEKAVRILKNEGCKV